MNPRVLSLGAAAALAAAVAILVPARQRTLAKEELEHARLLTQQAEVAALVRENSQIASLRTEVAEMDRLREETRELHKLRNEVRQLREQQKNIPLMRAENERLRKLRSGRTNAAANAGPAIPFIGPAELMDRGQATPDAALLTFFWAMKEGNVERAMTLVTNPENLMGKGNGATTEQMRDSMKKEFETNMKGFRIVSQNALSGDEVQMDFQIAMDREGIQSLPLKVRRVNNVWKLDFESIGK